MSLVDRVHFLLITSCGLGLAPVASGTVGTLGGVVLAVLLQATMKEHALLACWIAAVALFIYGCSTSAYVARVWPNKDPGQFVLDEVVGYLVTIAVYAMLAGKMPGPWGHAAAFFAFRAFDVLKIQPARWLEGLPGALGIMADDQMAGVYAGVSTWLLLSWIGW